MKTDFLLICPRCGEWMITESDRGCSCGAKLLQTEVIYDNCFILYLNREFIRLNRILEQLYRKYVYSSPEFNEELFNKRQTEDDEFNEGIAVEDKKREIKEATKPHCPYCNSTSLTKITTGGRLISTAFFGFASGKIGKQWHCKQCGSNF